MNVTVLGSGEALGMPAPLCDCQYCTESARRRRPAVLVETADATVVLDVGPDLTGQLRETGTTSVDAFFVTHHHFDHVNGVHELDHAAMDFESHMLNPGEFGQDERPRSAEFSVYMSPTAALHLNYTNGHVSRRLDSTLLEHGESVDVMDLTVVPFPVEHARPAFDTLGYAVYHDDVKLVYAPDMSRFAPDRPAGGVYSGADLLVAEGAALIRAEGHGPASDLEAALESAAADRTVLVNLSEHLQRMTTGEMEAVAAEYGYELGRDFAEYSL